MHEPDHRDTVRSVIEGGLPLGVQCLYCWRRALIGLDRLARSRTKWLADLPLLCACGSRDVKIYVLETPDEQDVFRETGGAIRSQTGLWHPTF